MFQLLQELDQLSAEVIPQANLACDNARAHPHDPGAQNSLLEASRDLMDVGFLCSLMLFDRLVCVYSNRCEASTSEGVHKCFGFAMVSKHELVCCCCCFLHARHLSCVSMNLIKIILLTESSGEHCQLTNAKFV